MKKISLKTISDFMSEREMKDVKGGLDQRMIMTDDGGGGGGTCYLTCCDGSTIIVDRCPNGGDANNLCNGCAKKCTGLSAQCDVA